MREPARATGRRRARLKAVFAVALILWGWDLSRAPERQLTARVMLGGIHIYRRALSPVVSSAGVVCRFEPSCSRYAEVSIRKHGALRGGWVSAVRIARCGPWTPAGTVDQP